jgi:hypothetical protein
MPHISAYTTDKVAGAARQAVVQQAKNEATQHAETQHAEQHKNAYLVPLQLDHVYADKVVPNLLVRHHLVVKDVQDFLQADAVCAFKGLMAL